MKYDLSRTPSRGAAHTLETFSDTMFDLLRKKPFEKITINEVCIQAGFPRATFYNYFDDKFDLLDYCWIVIGQQLRLEEFKEVPEQDALYIYFDRIYDFLSQSNNAIEDTMLVNREDGFLRKSLVLFVEKSVLSMLELAEATQGYEVPHDILAQHFSNVLVLVFKWWFLEQHAMTKEEGHQLLDRLLYGKYN